MTVFLAPKEINSNTVTDNVYMEGKKLEFSFSFSILGRIIKISPEVLAYREWTIKKWGGKHYGKLDNHGKFVF